MITGRSYTLLPLQGEVFPVVLGYPGCRFACPGLSARWAFSPLHLMGPIVPDFVTSNRTPYQLCSNLSRSDEPRGEPSLLGLSRGENASKRKPRSEWHKKLCTATKSFISRLRCKVMMFLWPKKITGMNTTLNTTLYNFAQLNTTQYNFVLPSIPIIPTKRFYSNSTHFCYTVHSFAALPTVCGAYIYCLYRHFSQAYWPSQSSRCQSYILSLSETSRLFHCSP